MHFVVSSSCLQQRLRRRGRFRRFIKPPPWSSIMTVRQIMADATSNSRQTPNDGYPNSWLPCQTLNPRERGQAGRNMHPQGPYIAGDAAGVQNKDQMLVNLGTGFVASGLVDSHFCLDRLKSLSSMMNFSVSQTNECERSMSCRHAGHVNS